jgi:hypothetical protein
VLKTFLPRHPLPLKRIFFPQNIDLIFQPPLIPLRHRNRPKTFKPSLYPGAKRFHLACNRARGAPGQSTSRLDGII